MEKRLSQFWFLSVSLIVLRGADVAITFIVTPDLRWEINPLVSLAGQGWFALILANTLGVALAIGLAYFSGRAGGENHPPESGYSWSEFVSHYLFGDSGSFRKIYYVVPYNKRALLAYCGFVFIRVLTAWSLVVVVYNLLVWRCEAMRGAVEDMRLWIMIYILLVFLVVFYSLLFFKALYAGYVAAAER